jgi:hypothetical protein
MERLWKVHAGAAEFPHANPALDWGSLWLGTPLCQAEEQAQGQEIDLAAPLQSSAPAAQPLEPTAPEAPTARLEEKPMKRENPSLKSCQPSPDPWSSFVEAVAQVARRTAGEQAEMIVRAALLHGTIAGPLAPPVEAVLREADVLQPPVDSDASSVSERTVSDGFARTARAWRAVLVGEERDLSACGPATLDDWAARLVSLLASPPSSTSVIRRELRREGIVAFGMLEPPAHRARAHRARVSDAASAAPETAPTVAA